MDGSGALKSAAWGIFYSILIAVRQPVILPGSNDPNPLPFTHRCQTEKIGWTGNHPVQPQPCRIPPERKKLLLQVHSWCIRNFLFLKKGSLECSDCGSREPLEIELQTAAGLC